VEVIKYNIITSISSHKQEQTSSTSHLEITTVGNGSNSSIYSSSFPLQGIFRVGEGLEEQLQNQPCNLYFYRQVAIMMESFRIAQFLQQLHTNCLVGKTIKIHALTHHQLRASIYSNVTSMHGMLPN